VASKCDRGVDTYTEFTCVRSTNYALVPSAPVKLVQDNVLHCATATARGRRWWKRAAIVHNAVQAEMLANSCIEKLVPEATVGILLSIAPLI
jgi:hypothetical protein